MAEGSGKSAFYSILRMYDFLYIYNCYRADIAEFLPDKVLAEGIGPQLATAYFNLKMNQVGVLIRKASGMRSVGRCASRMHSPSLEMHFLNHAQERATSDVCLQNAATHTATRTVQHTATHCNNTARMLDS